MTESARTLARVSVFWDNEGVIIDPRLHQEAREKTAKLLSVGSGTIVAKLLQVLMPAEPADPSQICTGYGTRTDNQRPVVPVQIEVAASFVMDRGGVLWNNADNVRLLLAILTLNWFESQDNVCDAARINAIRVSVMGLGFEELIYELDPRSRIVIDGEGGDPDHINRLRGVPLPRQLG